MRLLPSERIAHCKHLGAGIVGRRQAAYQCRTGAVERMCAAMDVDQDPFFVIRRVSTRRNEQMLHSRYRQLLDLGGVFLERFVVGGFGGFFIFFPSGLPFFRTLWRRLSGADLLDYCCRFLTDRRGNEFFLSDCLTSQAEYQRTEEQ